MVRVSVLNDCLNNIVNAERRGKRQVLVRPSSKVVVKFLSVMQRHGYIGEFEIIDDHRSGKIVIQLNGHLNKTGVISPRFNVQANQIESWVNLLLPARGFGIIILGLAPPFLNVYVYDPMTTRDSILYSHDSQQTSPSPRRRRSQSSASARSLSNKRSPSPIVTFSPTPLSADPKGVKHITRKVIRTLEGLGHLDSTDMDEQDCESDEKCDLSEASEVEATLNGTAYHDKPTASNGVQRQNGAPATASKSSEAVTPIRTEVKKIDWEIPRKLLHSSIGFFTVYLYLSNGDVKTVIFILWTALAVIVPADILRLNSPTFERVYERFLGALMRESEKKSSNGVIWYILGVNFALTFYPLDVATVAILMYESSLLPSWMICLLISGLFSLSWADTAASTFGRLWGHLTPRLPSHIPVLGLPLAPRKSLAGFVAAAITGACIAVGFFGWVAPVRSEVSWAWDGGVRASSHLLSSLGINWTGLNGAGGWLGLGAIGLVAGVVSGVAEALDLGSLDDNLTLPIISGGCIFGFLKLLGLLSSPA
ncbi:hypothetical protein H0H81_011161 [Sphagnurus paluster]|uniref:Uncharacterized protein n=1 Tax=Sphagnurus paluster TaxID=117069 RepID=A0A9P7GJA1_9AGAR|nr:hypothetical protein H0H81_011161 [Sphagnurus paluster]